MLEKQQCFHLQLESIRFYRRDVLFVSVLLLLFFFSFSFVFSFRNDFQQDFQVLGFFDPTRYQGEGGSDESERRKMLSASINYRQSIFGILSGFFDDCVWVCVCVDLIASCYVTTTSTSMLPSLWWNSVVSKLRLRLWDLGLSPRFLHD